MTSWICISAMQQIILVASISKQIIYVHIALKCSGFEIKFIEIIFSPKLIKICFVYATNHLAEIVH